MEHFNALSPAEAERLALLAEECAEVIQVVGKILRHGYESRHPMGGATNRSLLQKELGDVLGAINILEDSHDIDGDAVQQATTDKLRNVVQWMHHQAKQAIHRAPQRSFCSGLNQHQFDSLGQCVRPGCGYVVNVSYTPAPPVVTEQILEG